MYSSYSYQNTHRRYRELLEIFWFWSCLFASVWCCWPFEPEPMKDPTCRLKCM